MVLLFLCFFFFNTLFSTDFATKLMRQNLSSLEWEDRDWPNESFYDYLKRCITYQLDPLEIVKRRLAFKLVNQNPIINSVLDDTTTWQELHLFTGKEKPTVYLGDIVSRTQTEIGKVTLFRMLASPTADIEVLHTKQKIIKELVKNQELLDNLVFNLKRMKEAENALLSFWHNDLLKEAAKRHYFKIPFFPILTNYINQNELILHARDLLGHQKRLFFLGSSTLASVILPLYSACIVFEYNTPGFFTRLAERLRGSGGRVLALLSLFDNKYIQAGATFSAGAYCALSVQEDYEWARDNFVLDLFLQKKLILVSSYFEALQDIFLTLESNTSLQKDLPAVYEIKKIYSEFCEKKDVKKFFSLLSKPTFNDHESIFSFYGRTLATYKLLHEIKQELEPLLIQVGVIDAFCSIAQLYNEFKNHPRVNYCFAEFVTAEKPFIDLTDFWNPFIDPEIVISSSIALGLDNLGPNAIITGPNAGGKSTIMKAIVINAILAHAFGITTAKRAVLTPLSLITTYLNIADDISCGNSLFKAQVLRAHYVMSRIEKLKPYEFALLAIDEMFSGTSELEGSSAAFSVGKYLGNFSNVICMIATHFPILTQLEEQTDYYTNFKVSVGVDEEGIHYPFKLELGISDQHVAIDILKEEGVESSILQDAYDLIQKRTIH